MDGGTGKASTIDRIRQGVFCRIYTAKETPKKAQGRKIEGGWTEGRGGKRSDGDGRMMAGDKPCKSYLLLNTQPHRSPLYSRRHCSPI